MPADNVFLRTEIDRAITSLVEQGIIADLLARHHFRGNPGGGQQPWRIKPMPDVRPPSLTALPTAPARRLPPANAAGRR